MADTPYRDLVRRPIAKREPSVLTIRGPMALSLVAEAGFGVGDIVMAGVQGAERPFRIDKLDQSQTRTGKVRVTVTLSEYWGA